MVSGGNWKFSCFSIIQELSGASIPAYVDLFSSEAYSWVATTENFSIKSVLHEAVVHGACDWYAF